ncbi:MAG: hypothetical protein QJR01_05925 [Kyrpidia sp.]|nr:hypothetical protein [Kyrpidia sp.]
MKVWWKLPVFGTALFLLLALMSGHLWVTALRRAGVCAALLTLCGVAGEWVWRWMAEAPPSTIDLRSAPADDDLDHLAFAREAEPRDPADPIAERPDPAPGSAREVERPSGGLSEDRTGPRGWTDLAAWVQRQQ